MYVLLGRTIYRRIRNLVFSPETDVTGSSVPVNRFTVDVITNHSIRAGMEAYLYDEEGKLWARYWVTMADRTDKNTVSVRAESSVKLLERYTLKQAFYNGANLGDILQGSVLKRLKGGYVLDSSLTSKTVTGYCPEQTARDRLQWLCLACGAYLKDYFVDRLHILPLSEPAETYIPADRTFWKPQVDYLEYVTSITATYYTYEKRNPYHTEKYVEVNGEYYVQTETEITLENPDAPSIALEKEVTIKGVTLVNQSNVDDILSRMSKYYFQRTEASLDVVDNGEFMPGQKVVFHTDAESLAAGYVNSCTFRFGTQAKASMELTSVDDRDGARVKVTYAWGFVSLREYTYYLPVGYDFDIEAQYVSAMIEEHWYVFRPSIKHITGTVQEDGNDITVSVEVALDLYEGDLSIVSVDSMTLSDGTLVIA